MRFDGFPYNKKLKWLKSNNKIFPKGIMTIIIRIQWNPRVLVKEMFVLGKPKNEKKMEIVCYFIKLGEGVVPPHQTLEWFPFFPGKKLLFGVNPPLVKNRTIFFFPFDGFSLFLDVILSNTNLDIPDQTLSMPMSLIGKFQNCFT